MDELIKIIDRLKKFDSGINQLIKETVEENSNVIIAMNRSNQLYEKGINSEGISIESYRPYRPKTIEMKLRKHQPVDRVTLRDTGDFQRSFYVVAELDSFSILASDWKTFKLQMKYREEILGLTDENMNTFSHEILKPKLLEALNG